MEQHSTINAFISFQRGEESGFTYFFKLHYRFALGYAISLIHEEVEAEDITEDCFVKLWQKRSAIKDVSVVKAYLFASIRNACFDYLKSKKKTNAAYAEISANYDDCIFDEEVSFVIPDIAQLQIEVEQLPVQKGKIVNLFYWHKKPVNEIAVMLDISPNTVRNQKVKAVAILKKKLTGKFKPR